MTLDTATNQALRERFNPEGSQLRAVQMRMLGMLKQLDSLCREHNIKWWLSSGSCLGAMRHGGFIPWDDDLDIEMEYPDYKRLIRLLRQGAIPGFALQDRKSDPEYMLTFPKWRDLHSRIEEQSVQDRRWKFQGVYIDIFQCFRAEVSGCTSVP